MNRYWKSIKVSVFGISVPLVIVLLVFLSATIFSLSQTWLNLDEWRTFDSSREYEDSIEHPDFKLDYPAYWDNTAYHGYYRGIEDVWGTFGGTKFNLAYSGLRLYWRSLSNPSLNEVDNWGKEIINNLDGFNISELKEAKVGDGNYPAWRQTFQADRKYMVVYILDDNGAYILLFNARPYDDEAEEAFQHILNSFQILKPENK